MANLIEKIKIGQFDVEILKEKDGIELSLGLTKKQIGFITIIIDLSSDIDIGDSVKFKYGPYKDFTVATGYFDVTKNENEAILTYSLPIAFKYLKFEIALGYATTNLESVISKIEFQNVERKVNKTGSFRCSDNLLNNIWEIGADTIKLCMYPNKGTYAFRFVQSKERIEFINNWEGEGDGYVLVDGCRRDREVWVGDLLPEIRTCLYAYNDFEIVRNSLQIFADQQNEEGFICASSVSAQDYLEYCCWYIVCLWEYYFISGDIEFLKKQKNSLSKLLEYIKTKRNSENLISLNKAQTWAWTLSRCGCVTSSNCVQSMAMECAAKCFEEIGDSSEIENLKILSEKIKMAIKEKAFDNSNGCFRDVADGNYPYYSLDANSLAILFDIADESQKVSSLKFIKDKLNSPYGSTNIYPIESQTGSNWPHNTEIWPFSVGFELDARFKQHDDMNALDLIKRCWGNMALRKTQTYWEIVDGQTGDFMRKAIFEHPMSEVDKWNSYCHGWSAGVTYSLSAYVAGIMPISAGFKIFAFDPHPCELDFVEADIPTSMGMISVKYKTTAPNCYEAVIDVPAGTIAVHNEFNYQSGKHVIKF